MFMSATEEQMALMAASHVSHVSYILLLYSASFLLFLFVCMLLHLYAMHAFPIASKSGADFAAGEDGRIPDANSGEGMINRAEEWLRNGHASRVSRDAEEFELEGLMSDEDEGGTGGKKTNGVVRDREDFA
jgi:hypothetical protein